MDVKQQYNNKSYRLRYAAGDFMVNGLLFILQGKQLLCLHKNNIHHVHITFKVSLKSSYGASDMKNTIGLFFHFSEDTQTDKMESV